MGDLGVLDDRGRPVVHGARCPARPPACTSRASRTRSAACSGSWRSTRRRSRGRSRAGARRPGAPATPCDGVRPGPGCRGRRAKGRTRQFGWAAPRPLTRWADGRSHPDRPRHVAAPAALRALPPTRSVHVLDDGGAGRDRVRRRPAPVAAQVLRRAGLGALHGRQPSRRVQDVPHRVGRAGRLARRAPRLHGVPPGTRDVRVRVGPHDPDFGAFHDVAAPLLAEHRRATDFFPQGALPANAFDVSSLPWAPFTGFNLTIGGDGWDHLAPIFTLGRYTERDGRTLLPWPCRCTTPPRTGSTRPGSSTSCRPSSRTRPGWRRPGGGVGARRMAETTRKVGAHMPHAVAAGPARRRPGPRRSPAR